MREYMDEETLKRISISSFGCMEVSNGSQAQTIRCSRHLRLRFKTIHPFRIGHPHRGAVLPLWTLGKSRHGCFQSHLSKISQRSRFKKNRQAIAAHRTEGGERSQLPERPSRSSETDRIGLCAAVMTPCADDRVSNAKAHQGVFLRLLHDQKSHLQ